MRGSWFAAWWAWQSSWSLWRGKIFFNLFNSSDTYYNSLLVHGFCLASSCAALIQLCCLLILSVMFFLAFSHLGCLMWCHHPDHNNIPGHSVRGSSGSKPERGVSYSGHSLPIPLVPDQLGAFLPVPLVCGSDSLHFPVFCQDQHQQLCLAPSGVSPHLTCYFRFLAVELLGSCAALNVLGCWVHQI